MPLTPADVHNVAFKKPPIGKRGYDDEEVDAFLDLVEAELARLIEENNVLRAQVTELESRVGDSPAPATTSSSSSSKDSNGSSSTGQYAALQQNAARQDETDPAPAAAAAEPGPVQSRLSDHEKASRILALASETADRHLSEAKAEAEQQVSTARAQAEEYVTTAREASQKQLTEARTQAEQHLGEAQAKANALISESQSKAAATEQAAQSKAQELTNAAERKQAEILRGLAERKSVLERRIETLRSFEAEYRSRVQGFLQNQLKELQAQPPLAPALALDDSGSDGASGETANAAVSGFVGSPDAGRPVQEANQATDRVAGGSQS